MIQHLLNHTAGVGNITAQHDFYRNLVNLEHQMN